MNKTICLTMIVKDEAHVIARCLRSVRPYVSSYCIADTGSTDETKAVIARELAGLAGDVFDRPWKDFSTNRNEVMERARGVADYNLVIDADDVLEGRPTAPLTKDFHLLTVVEENETVSASFERAHLFRNDLPFRYRYVLHEQIQLPDGAKGSVLPGLTYRRYFDGARSKDMTAKWLRDAEVCRQALQREPESQHYAHYLAQSLQAAGRFEEAIPAYREHLRLVQAHGGEALARWQSLFRIAMMTASRKRGGLDADGKRPTPDEAAQDAIVGACLRAYEAYPARLESLFDLAECLEDWGRWRLSYMLLKPRAHQPAPPSEGFSIAKAVYDWALKDRLATACLRVGDVHLARQLCEELLASAALPEAERERITMHFERARREIAKADAESGAVVDVTDLARRDLAPVAGDRSERSHVASPFFGAFHHALRAELGPGSGELALGEMLFALVVAIRARNVVEFGRYKGAGTFAIASALKFLAEEAWEETAWQKVQGGSGEGALDYRRFEEVGAVRKVYSVDPRPMPEAVALLARHGLKKYVTLIDARTIERERLLGPADVIVCNPGTTEETLAEHAGLLGAGGHLVVADARGGGAALVKALATAAPGLQAMGVDTGYRGFVMYRKPKET